MRNALAVYEKIADPIRDATNKEMVVAFAAMTGCNVQAAPAVMLACWCQGIDFFEMLRNYDFINGRQTKKTQAAVADFLTIHGGQQKIVDVTPEKSTLVFADKQGEETTWTLTIEEAHQAGWPFQKDGKSYKDNWSAPVKRTDMLYYRNASRALKKICPSIFAGLLTSEEAVDLDAAGSAIEANPPQRISAMDAMRAVAANGNGSSPVENTNVGEAQQPPAQDAVFVPTESQVPLPNFATRSQLDKLQSLRTELADAMPPGTWEDALTARNASTAHSLTIQQAQELIDKLETKRKNLQPVKN